ncbi:MAG: outer membrane protein assembly factor BamB [Verrucomicrobiales bacterium]
MRLLLAASTWLFLANAQADWPQFLGPNRNGVSTDKTPLTTSLPRDELKRLWSHDVGDGFAGPVVSGDRCLIFHRKGDRAVLESLDWKTGKQQWVFDYQTNYVDNFGFDPGPRSCPTVAGDRVFIHGVEGQLHAVQLNDGKPLWKRDLASEFASPAGFFGRVSAPLVTEDLVLLDIGGKRDGKPANFIAFDAATGVVKWTAGDGEADHGSPALMAAPNQSPAALFFVREGIVGVTPNNGTILFQERFRSSIHASVNAASPIVVGNRFFLSSCYNVGAGLWEWDGTKVTNVYKIQEALDCHFSTPVHHNGFLYGFHGRQETGQELRCIALNDGNMKWSTPSPAGSVIIADNKLLVLTERGELLVAEATPKAWQIHYRAQITGAETRALPALSNGLFYARDKRKLTCVDLSSK